MHNKRLPAWPNQQQLLILKAATLPLTQAQEAWDYFSANYHIDQLDESSQRLLPLVYYNFAIKQGNTSFVLRDLLKDRFMSAYAENHYLLNAFKPVLNTLSENHIPFIVIKGLVFLLLIYNNIGARKMMDIDLWVSSQYFNKTALILESLGWKTFKCQPLHKFDPSQSHALSFFNDAGHSIDLHYHLFHIDLNEKANEVFLNDFTTLTCYGKKIKTLLPTEHLIQCCFHGNLSGPRIAPLRWVADAYHLIEKNEIDWSRVIYIAKKNALSLYLVHTLDYLATHLHARIPPNVINELALIPVSFYDRNIYKIIHRKKDSFYITRQYPFYLILSNNKEKPLLYCFCLYLKTISSTNKLYYVPMKLPFKILKKLYVVYSKNNFTN